ncbi:MAG TPA: alcohol dehydrogenase catalytic domain-containing protein, partial [Candidatus Polarisedimenticolaceae bacterium]|nr:alcohol dehydrogenase catalytic domain-containing protein [Candidatus Polarisedimenticolaceae bacterium]
RPVEQVARAALPVTMHALWLERRRLRLRDDLERPDGGGGEAVVRVRCAGVCGTDLELERGYYPFTGVPGHEFVGIVDRGPDGWVGRRVVGEINASCGACAVCVAGRANHCGRRTVLGIVGRNGAFAEYLSLPVANLHAVPDDLPDDVAVFTEPLAAALRIGQQLRIGAEHEVLVVGDGKLGQLVARGLARTGCRLFVVGRHDGKLALLERAGIRGGRADAVVAGGYDVAVECTGNPDGFAIARDALRPAGTLVLKSTYAGRLTLDASSLVVDEITLVGSRCGPFAPALRLLAGGEIDPRPLIHGRYPLERAIEAFEHAARPGVLKILIDVER